MNYYDFVMPSSPVHYELESYIENNSTVSLIRYPYLHEINLKYGFKLNKETLDFLNSGFFVDYQGNVVKEKTKEYYKEAIYKRVAFDGSRITWLKHLYNKIGNNEELKYLKDIIIEEILKVNEG